MLKVRLDEDQGIAILEPQGELSKQDFESAGKLIDPYIEAHGSLAGIIIHVRHFPGWESFSSLLAHLKFIREHHKKISRVCFATDSPIGRIAEKVAAHFVSAEIRSFAYDQFEASRHWVTGNEN